MARRNADIPVLLMLSVIGFPTAVSITSNIDQYKPVHYDRHDLHRRHVLHDGNGYMDFHFKVMERMYHLRLRRNVSPLTTIFTLHHEGKKTRPDLSHIYHGYVKDLRGSTVHGAVLNGHFKGSIKIPGQEAFFIEPHTNKSITNYHSIMYSQKDVRWNDFDNFCGVMSSDESRYKSGSNQGDQSNTKQFQRRNPNGKSQGSSRIRKSPDSELEGPKDSLKKHICTLRLTVDHRLWDFMYRKSNENSDRTLNELLFMIESHVHELNDIFRQTVFTTRINNRQMTYKDIQFEIRTVQIFKPEDCHDRNSSLSEVGICMDGLSSELLLQQYSKLFQGEDPFYDYTTDYYDGDYPDYYPPDYYTGASTDRERICLNFLFTARVLFASNGNAILGQAYNAQVDKSGGVCFPRDNVGMITILQNTDLYSLPHVVTMNVFAHEVGHSFGAKHDDGKECASYQNPRDEPDDGYYLMHSVASPTRKKNNRIFSNCSKEFVARILTDNYYTECFEDSGVPFCGNNVIEEGEECDCGTNETCSDKCCYAKGEHPGRPDLDCKLKKHAICSPSQGPCCNGKTCTYIARSDNFVCENSQPCVDELYCDGEYWKAKCPPPRKSQIRRDGFVCNRNGRICEHGHCNASICNLIGWRECQSYNDNAKLTSEDREQLCYIGCQKNSKSDCISTDNTAAVQTNPDMMYMMSNLTFGRTKYSIQLPMGTPCNKMTGYCDVFYRCRGIDPDTPLVRLKNCILSGKCVAVLTDFLEMYWWTAMLCILAFLLVFITFLYCCTVHTKSSNPLIERRHPHRSFRDDIRTLSSIQRSIRHRASTFRRSLNARSESQEQRNKDIESDRSEKAHKEDLDLLTDTKCIDLKKHDLDDTPDSEETHELQEIEPLKAV